MMTALSLIRNHHQRHGEMERNDGDLDADGQRGGVQTFHGKREGGD